MYAQNLPYLKTVFENELNSIDNRVYQHQISVLKSILMSPIAGFVTGIYKHPGELVKAGEHVIRVENDEFVLLVATLVYPEPISLKSKAVIETVLFDSGSSPTTVTGEVVAVRGKSEDDHWEVIVKCNNRDGSGKPIYPLGYHFNNNNTKVSILE